jgi:AcrR family transcriptional regulator
MIDVSIASEGRERKKRERLQRIARTGLKLFVKNGYEGTTLEEIAAEAGIAQRTFFYYFKSKEAIVVDGLFGSTEALRARMQAAYSKMEQSAFEALCELWPQMKRRASLRIVAMVSIGALRVAKEAWRRDGGKLPLAKYLRESFATLEEET